MFTEMSEKDKKRSYRLGRRAEQQRETRQRIVDAAVALHEELGPRNTTISAIAARAGVQRLTVYRHFADEAAIFAACTGHWFSQHPTPGPSLWREQADPLARCRAALRAFNGYYRENQDMLHGAHRDLDQVPAMREPMLQFLALMKGVADDLAAGWTLRGKRQVTLRALIGHALAFETWRSLEAEGLDDDDKTELMVGAIACLVG